MHFALSRLNLHNSMLCETVSSSLEAPRLGTSAKRGSIFTEDMLLFYCSTRGSSSLIRVLALESAHLFARSHATVHHKRTKAKKQPAAASSPSRGLTKSSTFKSLESQLSLISGTHAFSQRRSSFAKDSVLIDVESPSLPNKITPSVWLYKKSRVPWPMYVLILVCQRLRAK